MLIVDWKINPVVEHTREEWFHIFGMSRVNGTWEYPQKQLSEKTAEKKKKTRVAWDDSVLAQEVARINTK